MGFDPQEVADWEAALAAAQHHADLMPMRERETHQHQPHSISQEDPSQVGGGGGAAGGGGGGAGGGAGAGDGSGRSIYNGATPPRKKPGRKPKLELHHTPEAKRARALDSMVSAAERSNALQKGAAEAGAEHLRRLELADAEVRELVAYFCPRRPVLGELQYLELRPFFVFCFVLSSETGGGLAHGARDVLGLWV